MNTRTKKKEGRSRGGGGILRREGFGESSARGIVI